MPNFPSNKITAIRLANLAEQEDLDLFSLIDFDNLQIHLPGIKGDADSKKKYFKDLYSKARMKILHILEEGLKVAIYFKLNNQEESTFHFHVYRFNRNGMLTDIWINS